MYWAGGLFSLKMLPETAHSELCGTGHGGPAGGAPLACCLTGRLF